MGRTASRVGLGREHVGAPDGPGGYGCDDAGEGCERLLVYAKLAAHGVSLPKKAGCMAC